MHKLYLAIAVTSSDGTPSLVYSSLDREYCINEGRRQAAKQGLTFLGIGEMPFQFE